MEQPEQVNMLDFFNYDELAALEQERVHKILHGPTSEIREPELPWETSTEEETPPVNQNVNDAQSEQYSQPTTSAIHMPAVMQPPASVIHPSQYSHNIVSNANLPATEANMFSPSQGIHPGMVPMGSMPVILAPYPHQYHMMNMPPPGTTGPPCSEGYMMMPMPAPGMGVHGAPPMTMSPVIPSYTVEMPSQGYQYNAPKTTQDSAQVPGGMVDNRGQGQTPRERRNKKKRPPDYYKKLEEQEKGKQGDNGDPNEAEDIESANSAPVTSVPPSEASTIVPSKAQYTLSHPQQNNLEISFHYIPNKESSSDTHDSTGQIMHSDQPDTNTSVDTAQNNNVIDKTPAAPRVKSPPGAINIGESPKNIDLCNMISFGTVGEVSPEKQILGRESPVHKDTDRNVAKGGCDKVSPSKENVATTVPENDSALAQVENQIPVTPDNVETVPKPIEQAPGDKPSVIDSSEDAKVPVPAVAPGSAPTQGPEGASSPPNAQQEKPKVASWASLLHGTSTANSATVVYHTADAPSPKSDDRKDTSNGAKPDASSSSNVVVPVSEDKNARQLGELLQGYSLKYSPVSLLPRGLHNSNNWCYINATLQALLACPAFYHLMKALPAYPGLQRGPSSTPVIDALCEFINEFEERPIQKLDGKALNAKGTVKQDVPTGPTFEPKGIFKMLNLIKYDSTFKLGKQEDAEEFLSCVLNLLHEEMVAAMKLVEEDQQKSEVLPSANGDCSPDGSSKQGKEGEDEEEDEGQWEQVGPKNKSVITRTGDFDLSPVSRIFRGQLRSVLHKPGAKESATLEPFYTLQLDIQNEAIWSVNDALQGFVSKETLQGYTCMKKGVEVDATRRILLEELPPVLILHLKCFVYDKNGGCQKVTKQIEFGTDLELSKDLLAPNMRSKTPPHMRKYKLFAVVNHLGARAIGGHYVADVYHPGLNGWLRCDDGLVRSISPASVTKFVMPKVPYLLYYKRNDLT